MTMLDARSAPALRFPLLVALLLAPALAASEPVPDPKAAAAGKTIYVRFCASCHGLEAKGDGPIAADLRVPPPDLTRLARSNQGKYPYDRVVRLIEGKERARGHGTPDMPVWGDVFRRTEGTDSPTTEAAVVRVAQYLWSVQEPTRK